MEQITRLAFFGGCFGPLSFLALQQHFSTLKEIGYPIRKHQIRHHDHEDTRVVSTALKHSSYQINCGRNLGLEALDLCGTDGV